MTSVEEIIRLLAKGKVHRETGATGMNDTSSRSHAIFQVHLESRPKGKTNDDYVRCRVHTKFKRMFHEISDVAPHDNVLEPLHPVCPLAKEH